MSSFQIADRITRIRESVPQNQPLVKIGEPSRSESNRPREIVHLFDSFTNFADFDNFGNG